MTAKNSQLSKITQSFKSGANQKKNNSRFCKENGISEMDYRYPYKALFCLFCIHRRFTFLTQNIKSAQELLEEKELKGFYGWSTQ